MPAFEEINVEYDPGATVEVTMHDGCDSDEQQRLKLEGLMRDVEKRRANVTVISTEHEAGLKLLALGGIAGLVRFPIYRDTPNK